MKAAFSRRALLYGTAAWALPSSARTGATQERPLRVAVIDVAPFGYRTDSGDVEGIVKDRLAALSQRSGLALAPVLMPYRRACRAVSSGEADLCAALPNPWVPKLARSLGSLMSLRIVAWPRAGLQLREPADLRALRVASLRGVQHETAPHHWTVREEMVIHRPELLRKLVLTQRVDVAIGVQETLTHFLGAAGLATARRSHALALTDQRMQLFARPDLAAWQAQRLVSAVG